MLPKLFSTIPNERIVEVAQKGADYFIKRIPALFQVEQETTVNRAIREWHSVVADKKYMEDIIKTREEKGQAGVFLDEVNKIICNKEFDKARQELENKQDDGETLEREIAEWQDSIQKMRLNQINFIDVIFKKQVMIKKKDKQESISLLMAESLRLFKQNGDLDQQKCVEHDVVFKECAWVDYLDEDIRKRFSFKEKLICESIINGAFEDTVKYIGNAYVVEYIKNENNIKKILLEKCQSALSTLSMQLETEQQVFYLPDALLVRAIQEGALQEVQIEKIIASELDGDQVSTLNRLIEEYRNAYINSIEEMLQIKSFDKNHFLGNNLDSVVFSRESLKRKDEKILLLEAALLGAFTADGEANAAVFGAECITVDDRVQGYRKLFKTGSGGNGNNYSLDLVSALILDSIVFYVPPSCNNLMQLMSMIGMALLQDEKWRDVAIRVSRVPNVVREAVHQKFIELIVNIGEQQALGDKTIIHLFKPFNYEIPIYRKIWRKDIFDKIFPLIKRELTEKQQKAGEVKQQNKSLQSKLPQVDNDINSVLDKEQFTTTERQLFLKYYSSSLQIFGHSLLEDLWVSKPNIHLQHEQFKATEEIYRAKDGHIYLKVQYKNTELNFLSSEFLKDPIIEKKQIDYIAVEFKLTDTGFQLDKIIAGGKDIEEMTQSINLLRWRTMQYHWYQLILMEWQENYLEHPGNIREKQLEFFDAFAHSSTEFIRKFDIIRNKIDDLIKKENQKDLKGKNRKLLFDKKSKKESKKALQEGTLDEKDKLFIMRLKKEIFNALPQNEQDIEQKEKDIKQKEIQVKGADSIASFRQT